nr:ORF4a [Bat coronavirus]
MLLLNVTTIIGCMLTATIHSNYLSISADTLERVDFYLASGRKVCQHSHSFNPTKYKCENNTLSVLCLLDTNKLLRFVVLLKTLLRVVTCPFLSLLSLNLTYHCF